MSFRVTSRFFRPETAHGVILRIYLILLAAFAVLLQPMQPAAQTVEFGDRDNVLTITVYDSSAVFGGVREFVFGITDLEQFPLVSVRTKTQWTNGVLHFRGPLMRDLLDSVGAVGDTILVNGLDGRSAVIPRDDIEAYDVIIACQVEGDYFGLRERGPLWVIYPWTGNPEIQSTMYYERGVYHLSSLSVTNQ